MNMSSAIRRFINALEDGQVFTSSELIGLGTRGAIDMALSRLVKKKSIQRLGNGLYMKGDEFTTLPPVIEVAQKKANTLGKELYVHGDDLAARLQLKEVEEQPNTKFFWVNGPSSSFQYGKTRIVLQSVSGRKLDLLKKGGPALSLAALWHLKKEKVTRQKVCMTISYNSQSREKLKEALKCVPQWLADFYPK